MKKPRLYKSVFWDDPIYLKHIEEEVYKSLKKVAKTGELQKIHTPIPLCNQILDRLEQEIGDLTKCRRIAVLFNLEFVHCLVSRGVKPSQISFLADSRLKIKRAREWYNIKNVYTIEYDSDEKKIEDRIKIYEKKRGNKITIMPKIKKQFDVVIMNPPYQAPKVLGKEYKRGKCGSSLWDRFIPLVINLLNDDGILVSVNPSSWRLPNNPLWAQLREGLRYVEMHSHQDGAKVFGKGTRYDCIVFDKSGSSSVDVVDETGEKETVDLREWTFLPNWALDVFGRLLSKNGEPTVELLHSYSEYETRKPHMNKEGGKYPCIYMIGAKNDVTLHYSSKKGSMVGVPKVVFVTGCSSGFLLDLKGEYGLTQFARGIVDTPKNLPLIYKALMSDRWKKLRSALFISQNDVSKDAFACLRKDFWKEFI